MKIALIGYGAMGVRIGEAAKSRGHEVGSIIDPKAEGAFFKEINSESLEGVDVAIDFTHPSVVVENIRKVSECGANLVVGTTGWHDRVDEAREMVKNSGIGFLWSSNFSIGVNVYFKIVEAAAKLFDTFPEYDVWGTELHHRNKADSPSGTAKKLEEIILRNLKRKTKVAEEKLDRKLEPEEFHFSSTRGGEVNFVHTIGFDSSEDVVLITHRPRSRDGYVVGAVQAAEWLQGKRGFFGMEDFLDI